MLRMWNFIFRAHCIIMKSIFYQSKDIFLVENRLKQTNSWYVLLIKPSSQENNKETTQCWYKGFLDIFHQTISRTMSFPKFLRKQVSMVFFMTRNVRNEKWKWYTMYTSCILLPSANIERKIKKYKEL